MRFVVLAFLAACGGDSTEPLFRADYAATYVQVRDCRSSGDHQLHKIRILADPAAVEAYTTRAAPFPVGAIVLKEEYDFGDTSCTGELLEWTVMQKLDATNWSWQRVTAQREVTFLDEEPARCINCHVQCGRAPDGHDGTCALP